MVVSYQRRVWQHIFEDRSRSQLSDAFESVGWVVEPFNFDYGEDLLGRPFEDGNPTGHDFYIQLKGTDDVEQYRLKRGKWLSYPIELVNLAQWYTYSVPVVFVLWDIKRKVGYWVHVQPFIKSKLMSDPAWLENTSGAEEPSRRVRVPASQTITEGNLSSLERDIEAEWRKIEQGKSHFDVLYRASACLADDDSSPELPLAVRQQLRITELKAVVSSEPQETKGWLDLASVYYETGNMDEALRTINRAWALGSRDRNIKQLRACVLAEYARRNRKPPSMIREAISLFQSTRAGASDPLTDYNIGNCYSELGQHQEAVKHYDKALLTESDPQQAARVWTNRGSSVDEIGDHQEAVQSFKHALEMNPSLWNAHASWASLEVRHKGFISACEHFHEAFRCNPDLETSGDNTLYWYAYSLHQIGELTEALSIVNHLLSTKPLHEEGLALKASLLYELRRVDDAYIADALTFFKSRILDDPTDWLARSELNNIYLAKGLFDEQRRLLEETAVLDGAPAPALYDYAMLLEDEGNIDDAVVYLERAAAQDQSHVVVHALARLKRETGHYDEAVKYYRMALIDVCDPLSILRSISDCYHFLGDYKNCVVVISEALQLGPREVAWWHNLHVALQELAVDIPEYESFLLRRLYGGQDLSAQEVIAELDSLMGDDEHPS